MKEEEKSVPPRPHFPPFPAHKIIAPEDQEMADGSTNDSEKQKPSSTDAKGTSKDTIESHPEFSQSNEDLIGQSLNLKEQSNENSNVSTNNEHILKETPANDESVHMETGTAENEESMSNDTGEMISEPN